MQLAQEAGVLMNLLSKVQILKPKLLIPLSQRAFHTKNKYIYKKLICKVHDKKKIVWKQKKNLINTPVAFQKLNSNKFVIT